MLGAVAGCWRLARPRVRHLVLSRSLSGSFRDDLQRKLSEGFSSFSEKVVQSSHAGRDSSKKVFSRVKGSILELMARNMSLSDREFMLVQWGQPSEDLKKQEDGAEKEEKVKKCDSIGLSAVMLNDSAESIEVVDEKCSVEAVELHPIFGRLLVDVGYKQVYVTSARRLVLAQVWQKQRTLRPERSEGIADVKKKSGTGFPGVITLFRDEGNGTVGIVDGQHRVGALLLMIKDSSWSADELNILIEVFNFKTASSSAIENLFTEINSAEPVKAIDMPKDNGDDNIKQLINDTVQALAEKYPAMFKPTNRCRAPHVHADSLRDELYSTEYLQRRNLKTLPDILSHFDNLNVQLGEQKVEYWGYKGDSKQSSKLNAIEKAAKFQFFLGLSKRWLHE